MFFSPKWLLGDPRKLTIGLINVSVLRTDFNQTYIAKTTVVVIFLQACVFAGTFKKFLTD